MNSFVSNHYQFSTINFTFATNNFRPISLHDYIITDVKTGLSIKLVALQTNCLHLQLWSESDWAVFYVPANSV